MNNQKWYKNSYRRNLIDMHIPDWNPDFFSEIDADHYVKMLKKANVDTAYIYTTSCVGLCNFPTKIGKMHEGLKGRDFIKEVTEGCRNQGIRPILYINAWSKWAYDTYPDWRCQNPEGKESHTYMFGQPGRYGVLCLNSPYKQYFLGLVKELLDNYETDGLWIDMILWRTNCTCPHCQERFKRETGFDLPMIIDQANPVFMQFMHKREQWLCEFFNEVKQEVYKKNPNASVVCNSAYHPSQMLGMSLDFVQQLEYITGDSSLGPVRSFEAKLFNNITANHPFEFLCSVMDPSLSEHSMLKTEDHLMQLLTSCLAHNGRNGFIDAIDPAGSLNQAVYERMKVVYEETDRYIPFLENEIDMCADVAIYTNFSCYFDPAEQGKPLKDYWSSAHLLAARAAGARLVEQNIPFDVITPLNLSKLNKFKAIVLPDVFVMEQQEMDAFREYVNNGGCIYASGRIAQYDGYGKVCTEGALHDLLGVRLTGQTDEQLTYIRPTETSDILPDYTAKHPLSCRVWQALTEADADTTVLGRLTLPIVHPKDITKFASAISDPPGRITEHPSIVEKSYGKGKVIYSAACLENLAGRDHSALFAKLLRRLAGNDLAFITNAPHPVEVVVYRQKQSRNYVINITNSTLPVLTLADITVSVKIPEQIKALYFAPDKEALIYTRKGDYVTIHLDKLHTFKMIIAEV